MLAVVFGAACFVPAPASAYYYRGRYYPYYYRGHYYPYQYRGHYYQYRYHEHHYRSRTWLSALMGVQDIIAIRKTDYHSALSIL